MNILNLISDDCRKENLFDFNIGDTVSVGVKIKEGEKERLQTFEGIVICKKGSGISESFTVRRISYGIAIERVFPVHSPAVASVSVVRRGKVRRAKLYYLRSKVGKSAKIKQKIV
ncbi:MAG: 50S ribosomal protein L19 [Oscillospiraceae bacterium]|nr:50S ribosomal protein L19 [Oscillospiraceae bacterium]